MESSVRLPWAEPSWAFRALGSTQVAFHVFSRRSFPHRQRHDWPEHVVEQPRADSLPWTLRSEDPTAGDVLLGAGRRGDDGDWTGSWIQEEAGREQQTYSYAINITMATNWMCS